MPPKQNRKVIRAICRAIQKNRTFFLTGHKKPDGDTVASELAMASLLKRLGKKVDIANAEPAPDYLSFLPGIQKIKTAKKVDRCYDVAMIFECSDTERMGNILDIRKQAKTVINIDHHLKHSFFGHLNLIGLTSSSNSEQLYYIYDALKMPILKEEATCLYVGMMTDTGRFQYSNTNPETLWIASKLLEKGVEVHTLCEKIYGTKTFSSLKLLSRALLSLNLVEKDQIATLQITKDDYKLAGSNEEETEDIVNQGLLVPSTLMAILFRETETENTVKVSFRSRRHVNVCALAERFGGGGHKYASGCEISGSLQNAMQSILPQARKALKN
ncbi:MAG: bifunctional oligoribonuclease/PAP phosphatase NrnA [Elusimicrobia bacterium]|nr:bifunctional oligoribonuclease/PAP phosphatase NrnA [Elusimicrobiota bacterium]MBI2915904.1 bifunctional oligoribonuclease/PAP phosphatase NrnA [Elusimicrobiota bacterium]